MFSLRSFGFLMRAIPVHSAGGVAVPAKKTESFLGVPVLLEPEIEPHAYPSSVLGSPAADMVDGQEFRVGDSAADAPLAVSQENGLSEIAIPSPVGFSVPLRRPSYQGAEIA